jgi:hypothetical protein
MKCKKEYIWKRRRMGYMVGSRREIGKERRKHHWNRIRKEKDKR